MAGLLSDPEVMEYSLGYRLFPEFWGKGLATEAATGLLGYGKQELGFACVVSLIREGNEASIRVATKVGAAFEKELPVNGHKALLYVYGTPH